MSGSGTRFAKGDNERFSNEGVQIVVLIRSGHSFLLVSRSISLVKKGASLVDLLTNSLSCWQLLVVAFCINPDSWFHQKSALQTACQHLLR